MPIPRLSRPFRSGREPAKTPRRMTTDGADAGSSPPAASTTRTRAGHAWASMWAAALAAIAFIVFLLSNTDTVRVSFLSLHGTLPLAVALLIAMVAGVVIALIVGTTRITQLRRQARRARRQ
ncbi:MAG: LapA family protein [Actinomadura rubrobrunea]|nr:LapA family protein [Actinomadura rubrobrunea]